MQELKGMGRKVSHFHKSVTSATTMYAEALEKGDESWGEQVGYICRRRCHVWD